MPNTATIVVTVDASTFVVNNSTTTPPTGPFTTIASMAFQVVGGKTQDGNGKVVIVTEGTESYLKVKSPGQGNGPGMNLVFVIASNDSSVSFSPKQIVFVGKAPPATDLSNGGVNSTANSITAVDSGNTTRAQWEYYIQIQKGSDATKVGWIDPGIENSDEL